MLVATDELFIRVALILSSSVPVLPSSKDSPFQVAYKTNFMKTIQAALEGKATLLGLMLILGM